MKKLKGLIAAPFTPMNDQGELALEQIEKLVRLYEKNEVKGAFICGSTGEGVSLSLEEKKQVMEQWGKVKSDKVKALFMLGGTCLNEMQELAVHARTCNLDGISILCPFYFKPASIEQLVIFCKQVADVVPELPFYYYHIPALTGGHFSMLEFLKLADEQIPNLAGIKYTHPNIMEFHACTRYKNGKYDLLWGIDEGLLSGLAIGAKGAVGSTYNYAAPLYNQVIKAFEKGDLKEAENLQYKAVQMVELLIKYGGTGAGKAFMKLIGVDCGWFRSPISSLTEAQVGALKEELEELGFFEYCSQI
ncbi:MAG: N-acetylneuraminate lyase [Saprospiraceae bacterium]|jgi:N-acetylneuraminate lyase